MKTEPHCPPWAVEGAQVAVVTQSWRSSMCRTTTITKVAKRYVETDDGRRWSLISNRGRDVLRPAGDYYRGGELHGMDSPAVAEALRCDRMVAARGAFLNSLERAERAVRAEDPAGVAKAVEAINEAHVEYAALMAEQVS